MGFELQYNKAARKSLLKLPLKAQKQITDKLNLLCANPYSEALDVKRMQGEHYFRLRAGNYRVLYELQQHRLIILVLDVGHRQTIYNA